MLRAVAFQNFIKFRHHQSLEFEDGPNFIVGPNASGKSAIFELIRRCLSNTVNISTSTVADKEKRAFVISKFEISQKLSDKVPKDCLVYSCLYINQKDMYKLVSVTNTDEQQGECHLDYYQNVNVSGPLPKPQAFTLPTDSTELSQELDKLIKNELSLDKLDMMVGNKQQPAINVDSSISECEKILQAIQGVVVLTFPIRSPGPMQWSHSELFVRRNENYETASDKAEILKTLLPSIDVDMKKANKIFEMIICPLKYKFEIPKSSITVNDGAKENVKFLKMPEGIIEAKQFSLMFAHRKYQTLVLEEPDRGMHPHMTQKLRDLVLRTHTKDTKDTKGTNGTKDTEDTEDTKDQRKVLVFTTHQTAMINHWSMSRMFICRRAMNNDIMEHRVFKLSSRIKKTYVLEDILKEMVFSEAVLFVEGFTDKKVIRSVFDRVLEAEHMYGLTETQLADRQKMAARTQIISMEGSRPDTIGTLTETGKQLDIPCKFLLDRDTVSECFAEVQPKDAGIKWKNKASFCARTLLKRTKECRDENQVEESENATTNLKDVMDKLTKKGNTIQDELGLKGDLTEVETTDVVSFIRRVVLPIRLTELKPEENKFRWKSGNLEDLICTSILGDQTEVHQSAPSTSNQTDIDVGLLLQKMFLCEYYDDSKKKDPVKETLKQMDIETAEALSTCLLKRGEMITFLQFLEDIEKQIPDRTNEDKTPK